MNVLIVEDEALVALDLSMGLQKDGYQIVGIADNAKDAEQLFLKNEVDIILMDINILGDKDGIDTAIQLLKHKKVPVIYLTAITDTQTVNRVKQTHPAAFLTKPYNINNVRIAIELAINEFAAQKAKLINKSTPVGKNIAKDTAADKEVFLQMNNYLFVKQNYRFVKLNMADIHYAEADGNYINLVTKETKMAVRLSLNLFMEKINFSKLVRIHRSFAVNTDSIQSFNDQEVTVNNQELPIGRNYKESFLQHFFHR